MNGSAFLRAPSCLDLSQARDAWKSCENIAALRSPFYRD